MKTLRKIFKYKFVNEPMELPVGAKFLHCGNQNNELQLWFEVDPSADKCLRRFTVFGTGHEIHDNNLKHLATVFQGPFVWHLYEVSP